MAFFSDVATGSQSYDVLYGRRPGGEQKTLLGKPHEYADGTVVKRYSLQRVDGQKPYASKKVVTLPKNSPLRRLNLDKFELIKEKAPKIVGGGIAPGLKKSLKLLDQDGRVMFEGADSIRQFMKTIAHVIRK